jgi:hypothetical protein
MLLEAAEQRLVEPHQGFGLELFARLAKGRRSDAIGERLVVDDLEETIELIADTALA